MGNQKFSIHGHAQVTLDQDPSTVLDLSLQDILPVAYYIKKILLYFENDSALTKAVWVTYHVKETTAFDAIAEDTKYMGLQSQISIAPINGLDTYSFFRAISANYSPQFSFLPVADGSALMVEMFTNIKVSAGNKPEIEIWFDTYDDGNQGAAETMDIRVSMECVVA